MNITTQTSILVEIVLKKGKVTEYIANMLHLENDNGVHGKRMESNPELRNATETVDGYIIFTGVHLVDGSNMITIYNANPEPSIPNSPDLDSDVRVYKIASTSVSRITSVTSLVMFK